MINDLALSIENGIKIQCKRCHHLWQYRGKNDYLVSCPHCGTKIGIKKLLTTAGLDTYEAILDNVHFPALGSSEDDARQCLQSWLDKFTEGYKFRRLYLKKPLRSERLHGGEGIREQSPRPQIHRRTEDRNPSQQTRSGAYESPD
jgi:hypothetical protein